MLQIQELRFYNLSVLELMKFKNYSSRTSSVQELQFKNFISSRTSSVQEQQFKNYKGS